MAIVPDKECKIPTLIVSPLVAAAFGSEVAAVLSSGDFEQPVKVSIPNIAATIKFLENFLFDFHVLLSTLVRLFRKFERSYSNTVPLLIYNFNPLNFIMIIYLK